MMSESAYFTLENRDNILDLTMNAPGNNIMTAEFISGFVNIVKEVHKTAAENSNIKGLIIHGSGRHFSVGADVTSLVERTSEELAEIERTGALPEGFTEQKDAFTSLSKFYFPVVSVVNGFCIGSGSEIAVNSNFRICEPAARAGQPESTFGILPALGGITRSAAICGLAEAVNIVMSGELFNAEHAGKTGWADILCEKKQGYSKAVALIEYISSKGSFDPAKHAEYIDGFLSCEVA